MTHLDTYIKRIRTYLKDYANRNELLNREESTNEEIEEAIQSVYDDFVIMPPIKLTTSLEDATKYLFFKYGVLAQLLDSEAILNYRNALPYQDSGTQIDENAKAIPYTNAAMNMMAKYSDGLLKLKLKTNLENFQWNGTSMYEFWDSIYSYGGYTNYHNRPII